MEVIKKTILQAVTTGTTITGGTIIIPDLNVTYYLKIGLKQFSQDLGFFDSYPEPLNTEPLTASMLVTGTTNNSRLSELKKYVVNAPFNQQYVSGGGWTTDGVDYNVSTAIEYVVYYIGGVQYLDETLIDGTHTSFKYNSQGITDANFTNDFYFKNPNKEGIISNPKINDDVFIVRDNLSAFNENYKLEYVRKLVELTTYAGGKYFNIINNT